MAVPGFEAFLLPVLRAFADGRELPSVEARARVAAVMSLGENDLAERLPNSPQSRAANRVSWAQIYLQRAALPASRSSMVPRLANCCTTSVWA